MWFICILLVLTHILIVLVNISGTLMKNYPKGGYLSSDKLSSHATNPEVADGVQDMLFHHIASWHIGYLKLKNFEKMTRSRKATLIFLLLSSMKQVIKLRKDILADQKTVMWKVASTDLERSILMSNTQGTRRIWTNRPC